MQKKTSPIVIYQTADGQAQIEVRLAEDTVWLDQRLMGVLFGRDYKTISKHILNVFKEGELERDSVVANFATTAADGKTYQVEHYNLDVVISVGYRVKSKRGTQFRIWASRVLKDYLVKGYALHEKRLKEQEGNLSDLRQAVQVIQNSLVISELQLKEAQGLLEIITGYAHSLTLLERYDKGDLPAEPLHKKILFEISYPEAVEAIRLLKGQLRAKGEASELFGRERDETFRGILGNIVQTFDGQFLYPSIEEQAAHLLYFVIKNHPFSDGNKRIGALLFVWFLERNRHLHGFRKINESGLTALALLVAQSDPAHKDIMVRLIINLVNRP